MCSVIFSVVALCFLQFTQAANLKCFHGSLQHFTTTPLDEPLAIMPCINPSLPTVVYTFGYRGKLTGPASRAVLNAYITKRKKNVILLDWEEEAQSGLLGIALGYALSAVPKSNKEILKLNGIGHSISGKNHSGFAMKKIIAESGPWLRPQCLHFRFRANNKERKANTFLCPKQIGKKLGEALVKMAQAGINMTDVHLVGHSLGAHIMGFAGRRVREQGFVVTRITGLDPARALFEGVFAVNKGLDRTCAKFVDIIHSDPGGYGLSVASGTVDIWPNYARNGGLQPGCPHGSFEMFTREDLCSHDRSWHYFIEALGAPTSFSCAAATDYEQWVADGGEAKNTIYLGDLTSMRAKGNYFFNTKPGSPYGMGAEGMKPVDNQPSTGRSPTLIKLLRYFK